MSNAHPADLSSTQGFFSSAKARPSDLDDREPEPGAQEGVVVVDAGDAGREGHVDLVAHVVPDERDLGDVRRELVGAVAVAADPVELFLEHGARVGLEVGEERRDPSRDERSAGAAAELVDRTPEVLVGLGAV